MCSRFDCLNLQCTTNADTQYCSTINTTATANTHKDCMMHPQARHHNAQLLPLKAAKYLAALLSSGGYKAGCRKAPSSTSRTKRSHGVLFALQAMHELLSLCNPTSLAPVSRGTTASAFATPPSQVIQQHGSVIAWCWCRNPIRVLGWLHQSNASHSNAHFTRDVRGQRCPLGQPFKQLLLQRNHEQMKFTPLSGARNASTPYTHHRHPEVQVARMSCPCGRVITLVWRCTHLSLQPAHMRDTQGDPAPRCVQRKLGA